MAHPKIKISDDTGNTVNVSDIGGTNALDVNILGATISAGDLEINSEFPAAATIADNFSNPTTTSVMSMLMGYDGAAWDRLVIGGGTEAAALRVTLASNTTGVLSVDDNNSTLSIDDGGGTITVDGTVSVNTISGFATASNQLAAGHTIDCNSSYIKIKAEDGTAITDGTNSGKLDVTIHSNDGSAFTDTAGKMNIQFAGQAATVEVVHDITGIASDDNETVGTSAEKISGADGDVACKRIDIMAHPDNTGYIWIGDSAVSVNGENGGIRLSPGDFYSMDIDNTGDVYAIATVNGENVCFNYFT